MQSKKAPLASGGLSARHILANGRLNALAVGTTVLTLDGTLPVEFLNPGDRVITRNSGTARLVAMRPHRVRCDAVAIAAGSLGNARPDQDAVLCASQVILVRDWRAKALFGASQALVPVSRLVDGAFVRALGEVELDVIELHFDEPQILYGDGLELASALPSVVDA